MANVLQRRRWQIRDEPGTFKVAAVAAQETPLLDEEFDLVVQQLYGGVDEPGALPAAFGALADGLGLDGWALVRLGDVVDVTVMGGACWDAEETPQYLSCYEAIAPLARLAAGVPVGELLVSHAQLWPPSLVGAPSGAIPNMPSIAPDGAPTAGAGEGEARHWAIAWCAHVADDQPFVACLLRAKHRGPFGLNECGLAGRFAGHLQQVLHLQDRLGQLTLRASAAEAALDSTALAVFGLDDSGRVRYANRRARGMTASGRFVRLHDGRLRLPEGEPQDWLARTLAGSAEPSAAATHLLRDPEGRSPEAATLLPLQGPDAGWLCLLTPLHARRMATERQLGQTFSFTPAEARLARALATGASLERYADEARIHLTTARAQLQAAMDKTGAERQSGLVRMVSALPPVRHGGEHRPSA